MNEQYATYETGQGRQDYPGKTLSQTMPGNAPTQRDTIQQALDEQTARLTDLHKLISGLEERLALVLGPPPAPNGNAAKPLDPIHVLDRVRFGNSIVAVACERLSAIIDRLQL